MIHPQNRSSIAFALLQRFRATVSSQALAGVRRAWQPLAALAIGLMLALSACIASFPDAPAGSQGSGDNLLQGRTPRRVVGVRRAGRLSDGAIGHPGDHWNTNLSATFNSAQAYVEWDLGDTKQIRAGYLQGDNNDTYIIWVSDDGENYKILWEAGPTSGGGMQARSKDELVGRGRYVRLSGRDGDGLYALTEVQLFPSRPAVFPPKLAAFEGMPFEEILRTKILVFGLALGAMVLLAYKGARTWWTLTLVALALAAGWDLWRAIAEGGPAGMLEVSLVRGMVAAVACVAVIREAWSPPQYPADRRVVLGALGLCAVLSFASFYNLGHLQFFDRKDGTPSFVHTFDMRVYYPVAKYWKELGYDGVYLASVAAAVDDDPSVTMESLGKVTLRSMKTHRTQTVSEVRGDIEAVRARFSPERWEEFKIDMRYFRHTMGARDYLSTLTDHGANATPVWMAIAHYLFKWTNATDRVLVLGGLLDPILLLITFGMIWRTFGLRTMLVSVVIFGANDYYMFGSNWAGATLRHDWMAYLGIGVCLLAREKWAAGGALLMMSALIRAFPALALVGAVMPGIWWVLEYRKQHGKLPSYATLMKDQRPLMRMVMGAAICGVVAFVISSMVCSLESWPAWYRKVVLLDTGAAVNQVSLRGLLGGTDAAYSRLLKSRAVLQWAGIFAFMGMVFAATRRKNLYHAAILGMMGVPLVFNPANYYSHFIFVIAALGATTQITSLKDLGKPARGVDAGIWVTVLLLCAMQYQTVPDKDVGHHFVVAGALLMVALVAILLLTLARDYQLGSELPALAGVPQGGPAPKGEGKKPAKETPKEPVELAKEPVAEKKEPAAEAKEPVAEKKEPAAEAKEPASEAKEPVAEAKEPEE
ncbi:MAG: hypothetical protein HY898_11610 [Deltaproteobacteria bacterium]|nr:hypothetical protein [Deltaproteobacteria bacterium]